MPIFLAALTTAIPSGTKLLVLSSKISFNSKSFSLNINVSGLTVIINLLWLFFKSLDSTLKYEFLSLVYNFFKYLFIKFSFTWFVGIKSLLITVEQHISIKGYKGKLYLPLRQINRLAKI